MDMMLIIEKDDADHEHPLNAARGILNALLMSAASWVIIFALYEIF